MMMKFFQLYRRGKPMNTVATSNGQSGKALFVRSHSRKMKVAYLFGQRASLPLGSIPLSSAKFLTPAKKQEQNSASRKEPQYSDIDLAAATLRWLVTIGLPMHIKEGSPLAYGAKVLCKQGFAKPLFADGILYYKVTEKGSRFFFSSTATMPR
jgi:hypothetical protein